jgi:hypothetical protein
MRYYASRRVIIEFLGIPKKTESFETAISQLILRVVRMGRFLYG